MSFLSRPFRVTTVIWKRGRDNMEITRCLQAPVGLHLQRPEVSSIWPCLLHCNYPIWFGEHFYRYHELAQATFSDYPPRKRWIQDAGLVLGSPVKLFFWVSVSPFPYLHQGLLGIPHPISGEAVPCCPFWKNAAFLGHWFPRTHFSPALILALTPASHKSSFSSIIKPSARQRFI